MDERVKVIDSVTASLADQIGSVLGVSMSIERRPDNPLIMAIPPLQLKMLEVGLFAESEMLRANEGGAYFAACLAAAAMNEALLTLMCLMFEREVVGTKQFQSSRTEKKLKNKRFDDLISRWQLQQLIHVAQELNWVPTLTIRDEIKEAFSNGYREVVAITHPEYSKEHVQSTAESFYGEEAGAALLTFTQEIRNLIHAGKWLRIKEGFNPDVFATWCQFSIHVFAEVRTCLMHTLSVRNHEKISLQLAETMKKVGDLPEELQAYFRETLQSKFTGRR